MTAMIWDSERDGVSFVWEGGPLIDIHWLDARRIRGHDPNVVDDPSMPFDVINVWNGRLKRPRILVDRESMIAECERWLDEGGRANLPNYLADSL